MQTENHEIEVKKGSGNIFADLRLEDADELLARSQIGFFVFKILEDKKLKQREIASVLGRCHRPFEMMLRLGREHPYRFESGLDHWRN